MNLSPRWVDRLAEAGFEVAHWSTLGAADATDTDFMAFARAHGYVVLTHDLDFGAILAASQDKKPSVVQIRSGDISPDRIAGQVIAALRQLRGELEAGALVTLDPGRTRLRLLPLPTG